MVVLRSLLALCVSTFLCATALAQEPLPEPRDPKVYATWERSGVTTLDRAVPVSFVAAPLPALWLSPRLGLGHFPFAWVEAGLGLTVRGADWVRLEATFDYGLSTFPERPLNRRLFAEGTLGVRVWGRQSVTRWRYALNAQRPQSQYSATKLQFVDLDLPSREIVYVEAGLSSATLGFRRCLDAPCATNDDLSALDADWVHHARLGARFSRVLAAHLDNSDTVRSSLELAGYALASVGRLPKGAIFEAPAFKPRTKARGAAPIGGEVHVRYTPWYYQWVTVDLMLGYLPGPRSAEFRLGFSLPLWLAPWEVNRQFKARTGGKSARN